VGFEPGSEPQSSALTSLNYSLNYTLTELAFEPTVDLREQQAGCRVLVSIDLLFKQLSAAGQWLVETA